MIRPVRVALRVSSLRLTQPMIEVNIPLRAARACALQEADGEARAGIIGSVSPFYDNPMTDDGFLEAGPLITHV